MNQGSEKITKNIITTIRLSCIKQLILPMIFTIIICFLMGKIPFSDILIPKNINDLSSLSMQNIKNIEYFSIPTQGWMYSGYNNYKDKSITEYIYYNIIDDNCYFMLVTPKSINTADMTIKDNNIHVTAHERTDSFNSFLNQFALDINWNYESLNEACVPIILTTASYNITFYKILFVVFSIVLFCFICQTIYCMATIIFPLLCPEFSRKHWHSTDRITSRSEFAMLLQAETDAYIYKTNNLYITKNYIINLTYGEFHIIPLNKLCFVFEHGNLHKFFWYMKVTHTIYFLCSNSLKCHFTHNKSGSIDKIMHLLKELIPDLMVGYSTKNQLRYMEIIKEKRP